MYKGAQVGLVIIAYNEELLIGQTLENVPSYIDDIILIDDCSIDKTSDIAKKLKEKDERITFIRHEVNQGPGGAIITGYLKSSELNDDVTVVIGGDNQMDQTEMHKLIDPIIDGKADYTKGNRFLVDAFEAMPFKRILGNVSLSILTCICAWNFSVFDTQDGYTAISKKAIDTIDWSKACKAYGYVSDFVIRIDAYGLRILDIPRRSIYFPNVRQSQIVIGNYIKRIFSVLFNALKWKLQYKNSL